MQLPLSILVVDDEVDISMLLKQFLLGLGINAVSFTNPLLAFEHLKNSHLNYSLIITDLKDQSNFKLADIENIIQKPIKLSHLKKIINQTFQQQISNIKNNKI